jgi:hypothetical protein
VQDIDRQRFRPPIAIGPTEKSACRTGLMNGAAPGFIVFIIGHDVRLLSLNDELSYAHEAPE